MRIVNDDGKLIGELTIGTTKNEIADSLRDIFGDLSADEIVERDVSICRNVQSNACGFVIACGADAGTMDATHAGDVCARAHATKCMTVAQELIDGVDVARIVFALPLDGRVRKHAKRFEIADLLQTGFVIATVMVDVFDAESPEAGVFFGETPTAERGDDRAKMQWTRR